MNLPFTIAHAIPGRTRLRWAGEPAGRAQLQELAARIDTLADVDTAVCKPASGSIILYHDAINWRELQPELAEQVGLSCVDSPIGGQPTGLDVLNRRVEDTDRVLRDMNLDLNSMTMLMILVLAVVQAVRGQVMVPSASLLWFAYTMATRARDKAGEAESTATV